jgi:hypothetical protein
MRYKKRRGRPDRRIRYVVKEISDGQGPIIRVFNASGTELKSYTVPYTTEARESLFKVLPDDDVIFAVRQNGWTNLVKKEKW